MAPYDNGMRATWPNSPLFGHLGLGSQLTRQRASPGSADFETCLVDFCMNREDHPEYTRPGYPHSEQALTEPH